MNDLDLQVKTLLAGNGRIEVLNGVSRLLLSHATHTQYSNSQLDDRLVDPNRLLIHRPPLRLTLRAHFSHKAIIGTAGFGFWNNPMPGLSNPLPLPRAIWYFYASPPSHMDLALGVPGCGWKAAMIDATKLSALAMAPLALPVVLLNRSQRLYHRIWPFVQRNLTIQETLLPLSLLPEWHTYVIEWGLQHVVFRVDDEVVLQTDQAPRGPMCFVAWIDNRLAIVTPTGAVQFGLFDVSQPQWLEIEDLNPIA
jgi:hypothetical protein